MENQCQWHRPPSVAGSFYSKLKEDLNSDLDKMMAHVKTSGPIDQMIAIIVPHAGYMYSGLVAANAYSHLRDKSYETVVMLGVNHRLAGFQGISIFESGQYETPLGNLKIDDQLAKSIKKENLAFVFNKEAHQNEHSLEVQVPFIQKVLPGVKLLPIILSDYSKSTCCKLAKILEKVLDVDKHLLLASTDLSHFHQYDDAIKLDQKAIDSIQSLDPEDLYRKYESQKTELCGYGPVLTTLYYAKSKKGSRTTLCDYKNSGDVTGDHSQVVGYVSAIISMDGSDD